MNYDIALCYCKMIRDQNLLSLSQGTPGLKSISMIIFKDI